MLAIFLSFLESQQLLANRNETTLLAVSGGVDSVVLCHLFKSAGLPFSIAHCNFGLRGKEADQACLSVKKLAQYYQVAYYSKKFETKKFASKNKVSIQMAARTLRYQFFKELLDQHALQQVATAHHWDDSVETILFNFIKGTGITGFYGIQPINGQIIRPLLFAKKKEIISYAQQKKLDWSEDSSNKSILYQRNFIRNKIIPLIHHVNPNFESTTAETTAKLRAVGRVFQDHVAAVKKEIITFKGEICYVAIHIIAHLPWAIAVAFELLRGYGFTLKQINLLMKDQMISGKVIHSAHHLLYVDRKQWLIVPKKASDQQLKAAIIAESSLILHYYNHTFHMRTASKEAYNLPQTSAIAALDYHKLTFPLMVRPWKKGDRFYPLGMQGSKKISDLLIDLKVPSAIKEKVVVVSSNNQLVWIVGYRIDKRFQVADTTEKIFEINIVE